VQPHVRRRVRRRHEDEAARHRLAGAALLGLAVLAWWALRAAGIA